VRTESALDGHGSAPAQENDDPMKLTPWYLAAIAPIAVAGCSGTFLGHFAVLAVTLGIFIGTLSLGRHTAASGKAIPAAVDGASAPGVGAGVAEAPLPRNDNQA
jgi:hypothetical protein